MTNERDGWTQYLDSCEDPAEREWVKNNFRGDNTGYLAAYMSDDYDGVMIGITQRKYIDINAENKVGSTLLHMVVSDTTMSLGIARDIILPALLNYPGIDVNHQDKEGRTPLHLAVLLGGIGTIKLLFSNPHLGFDLNAKDQAGKAPLERAEEYGFTDIAQAIKDKLDAIKTQREQIGKDILAALEKVDMSLYNAMSDQLPVLIGSFVFGGGSFNPTGQTRASQPSFFTSDNTKEEKLNAGSTPDRLNNEVDPVFLEGDEPPAKRHKAL